ncbi:hypothetical protein IBX73_11430 [candidate division WOR-3 bacterium]|nr:hypothetical protein [candidate division WOR-3 bacterium]
MATSENFEFIIRNFELDSDYYSETVGFVVQQSVAGYRINRDKFYAPRFMPMPLNFSFDEELMAQLLWLRCNRKRLFQKILKAIDVFFEAYYNTPAVCPSARVLLQVNAFEILLDLSSRTDFKNKLESLCTYKGEKKYSYYYEKHDPRIKKTVREKERRTLKGIWADRFYVLRNHIIHGRVVKPMDFISRQHQRHFDIALLFWVFRFYCG